MRLIVAGSRGIAYSITKQVLDNHPWIPEATELVCGCARGVDNDAKAILHVDKHLPVKDFPADWDGLGKRAGYVRNEEMADYADALIAIWDGDSKGTKHMIDLAEKKGLKVSVVRIN